MAQITYTNKETLNSQPSIADKNKVKAEDMNEIKSVVNTNYGEVGNIANLNTADKTNIVSAINEVNKKNIMTIGLTTYTSSLSAETKIPFTTLISSIGTKLTFDNNGIKIGSGISYIKVSGNMSVQYSSNNNAYSFAIAINGVKQTNLRAWATKASTAVYTASLSPILIPVQENDNISMIFIENNSIVRPESYLTVEVVS